MSKALPLATFPVDVPVHNLGGLPAVTRMLDVHKRRYESGSTMAILIALAVAAVAAFIIDRHIPAARLQSRGGGAQ